MTDGFAAPPAPDGTPAGQVRRADFRPTPPRRRRGRFPRWLTVLLAAGGVVILGGVATQVALTVRESRLTPAEPDATGRLGSAQVVSGMCLRDLGDTAGTVVAVDCDTPHAAEVVSSYTFTASEWPGAESVAATVLDYCASQLGPGGPLEAASANLHWVAWVPSEGTWKAGDRSGLCIVTSDEPWTGRATG